jgi:hypothetical protein
VEHLLLLLLLLLLELHTVTTLLPPPLANPGPHIGQNEAVKRGHPAGLKALQPCILQ